jgi:hypothetical protein
MQENGVIKAIPYVRTVRIAQLKRISSERSASFHTRILQNAPVVPNGWFIGALRLPPAADTRYV